MDELELKHLRVDIRAEVRDMLLNNLQIRISERPACFYSRDREVTVSLVLVGTNGDEIISQDSITIA